MDAWLHFFAPSSAEFERDVGKALEQAGITLHRLDLSYAAAGPGILFFAEVTGELCDALGELSRNGTSRIISMASSRGALANGEGWRLRRTGASDVLVWDGSAETAMEVRARLERWNAVDRIACSGEISERLVGNGPVWTRVLRDVIEAACFTNASILILGETGTGKELVARLVHDLDPRSNKSGFVIVDCTTIVPELSGSEFFGHERGAFTNAVAGRDGAFALANGGTLFLDEVGELPLPLQTQLLRVTQERIYKRVGGNAWQNTEFRLLCATNRNLVDAVADSQFRSDLYYRISTHTITLPPLRDRAEDILPLARHFMKQCRPDSPPPEFDPLVQAFLLTRDYPGNVRDLRQVVERLMLRHVGSGPITIGDICEEDWPCAGEESADWRDESFDLAIRRALARGIGLKAIGRAAEETAIRIAVGDAEGNLRRAAERLNVTDRALQMRRAARRI